MLRLPAWGNARIEYLLNPADGTWTMRRRTANESDSTVVGFASLEPVWGIWRRFYAFYAFEGHLYFQAGRLRWDITEGVAQCKFWWAGYGLASGLILHFLNGETHRPVLIHPSRAVSHFVDPTYDGIDAEADNFFFFIRKQLPDAKWRQGFVDRSLGLHETAA